jgi:superfamily II DNA or RNA helicase
MRERFEDEEQYAEETPAESKKKSVSVREIFQTLPVNNEFRVLHLRMCDLCGMTGNNSKDGPSPLVQCQGCTISIHKACMGLRSQRQHLVTKVGDEDFVLQCRYCIGFAQLNDPFVPHLGVCQEVTCRKLGEACAPFSQRKTTKQEEKLRVENGGVDPIVPVDLSLINNPKILLFRCSTCHLGYHFEHLRPKEDAVDEPEDLDELRENNFRDFSSNKWQCLDCQQVSHGDDDGTIKLDKVQSIVAWRPISAENFDQKTVVEAMKEADKEYLIKWGGKPYLVCTWMPGAWVWSRTAPATRNKFFRLCMEQNEGKAIFTERDAIPEEYMRIELVFEVKYNDGKIAIQNEEIDRARIDKVSECFVKFLGLGYDDSAWVTPPKPTDAERYADFTAAYNEFLAGKYFKGRPKSNNRLIEWRKKNFEDEVLMKDENLHSKYLTGGKLMDYQIEGRDFLMFKYFQGQNCILADEMGLGKTIQVIAALTSLIKDQPKVFPFLIVVPNSTCPNWRREIKQWAPSLRVVTYFGSKEARDMSYKYELYPNGAKELAAHIVVTSYEAPVQADSAQFFKQVKWAGLIVDEGQRLKNEESLLYNALMALKIDFRVLLTGTPLQNNKKELFTLLQFLDKEHDATALDEKYEQLTDENIPELHELIRPYFLRRTKAQVLKFLPPMAQVIVPVTMSTAQKDLYKRILSKSPDLLRAIMKKDKDQIKGDEKTSLNNILMQLRKCLCHPFMYSQNIEERVEDRVVMHRQFVEASAKFKLLEIMLPKLQEQGHRVLIFSQFLEMLSYIEDFLDGLNMQYTRLDGSVGVIEKQKRIDKFNAPESTLFAFLLSTRAGGVGINLATADTVIIMDPDFNPHQDLQALSRAHRIGQKNKVLVFNLVTKNSVEEKMVQIGRKKMALDHVLIEAMDQDQEVGVDLQSILKHGASAIFEGDDTNDIRYDAASVEKLLDRSHIENIEISESAGETQFSFAKVWQNDKGDLSGDIGDADLEEPVSDAWQKILAEREEAARKEELERQQGLGRGKRARQVYPLYSLLKRYNLTQSRP